MTAEVLAGASSSEVVWDAAARATAYSEGAAPICVAGLDGWAPDGLLAVAAAASVMTRFLALAAEARLEVLGYVSHQRAACPAPGAAPRLDIAPCITVSSDDDAARARALFFAALEQAGVACALRQLPAVDVHVSVVAEPRDRDRLRRNGRT